MRHYIAVLIPDAEGGWQAHFPDLTGCRAEGLDVEDALVQASKAASMIGKLVLNGGASPPRTLEEIRADETWAADRSID